MKSLVKNFNAVFIRPNGEPPGFFVKAGLGMTAGVIGSFVGTPAEVSFKYMLLPIYY